MSYTTDFEKECQETVERIAEKLEKLYEGNDDEIEELEDKLSELEETEPEEDDPSYSEWEEKRDELEEKIEDLKDEGDLRDYFDDYLDLSYTVNANKEYKSVKVWITVGGPGICVDTSDSYVKLYWGSTEKQAPLSYRVRDAIDEIFEEQYNW